jgi:hypothetical protein
MKSLLRWLVYAAGFFLVWQGLTELRVSLDTRPLAFGSALMGSTWLACGIVMVLASQPPIVDRAFRWLWRQDP